MDVKQETVEYVEMRSDELAFCEHINESLKKRSLDASFRFIKHKPHGGFDFDLQENIADERYLEVFDGLTMGNWLQFLADRQVAITD